MKARIPQGMGGGPGNMQGLMKQAQKMQEDMENAKAELAEKEYTINAGGGAVTIVISGAKEIRSIEIDDGIIDDVKDTGDIEILTDILTAGFNEAIKTVEGDAEARMAKITGQMSIPGLF